MIDHHPIKTLSSTKRKVSLSKSPNKLVLVLGLLDMTGPIEVPPVALHLCMYIAMIGTLE